MFKKSLRLFVVASSLAVVAHQSASAEPGALYDTSDASKWMVKYLGGENIVNLYTGETTIDENFAWQDERSYVNGVLTPTGYAQAQTTDGKVYWGSDLPWISSNENAEDAVGYYSFVTVINDAVDPTASFDGLLIKFTVDDHLQAVVINGEVYEGFEPQESNHASWMVGFADLSILPSEGITWNINGNNTIEFIVHNSGWYQNIPNPTGLSATIQASYNIGVIPEPPIVLMFATGLLVLPLARRLRKTA